MPLPPGAVFSLQSSVPANTAEPVPLENDLLRGRMLLMHRLPDGRPFHWENYFANLERSTGKPSVCEIQVQFEFKTLPRGTVWFGGEIHRPMELGIATRATCKVILSLLRKFADLPLHYSFGSSEEHAHICFPLRQAKMMVTDGSKPWPELGATLPVIGYPDGVPELRPGLVYTLAFSMRVMDLFRWELCNAPGLNGMKLTTFWKLNPLRIVIYDVPGSSEGPKAVHSLSQKRCFLDIELSNTCIGTGQGPEAVVVDDGSASPPASSEKPLPVERAKILRALSKAIIEDQRETAPGPEAVGGSPDEASDDEFGSCVDDSDGHEPDWESFTNEADSPKRDSNGMLVSRSSSGKTDDESGRLSGPLHISIPWIVTNGSQHLALLEARDVPGGPAHVSCRTWQELLELEALVMGGQRRRPRSNPDAQTFELERARLTTLFAALREDPSASDELAVRREVLEAFLRDEQPVDWSLWFQRRVGYVAYEGRIVLEALELRRGKLRFAEERLEADAIVQVRAVSSSDPLLRRFHCFEICTWERCYTFVTSSEGLLQSWLQVPKPGRLPWTLARLEDHTGLHRWQPSHRRVWNDRRLSLEPFSGDPLAFSVELLLAVARVQVKSTTFSSVGALPARLCELSEMASSLKRMDLTALSRWELLAFWLNVYHALLIHARLGSPEIHLVRKFIGFHNYSSYIVAGQPWSLTEIEHLVLRGRSGDLHSGNLLYRWLACAWQRRTVLERAGCLLGHPSVLCTDEAHWRQFQVVPDRRLNFIINCGTESCAPEIFAFSAGNGDAQLLLACRAFFHHFPITMSNGAVQLPRTLKWYVEDSPDGAPEGWLPYLSRLLEEPLPLSCPIAFLPFNWTPRGFLEVAVVQ